MAPRAASSRLGVTAAAGLLLLGAFVPPAAAQFGRNKLQHQVFDFRVISTPHFEIHYYPEERRAALDAARMAERAYVRLSRILGHEFEERKPIILYASHSHFQQTNAIPGFISEGTGGVTEFAKRRIILPFTGSYADFEHVLTHELVHAFQVDIITRGVGNALNPFSFRPPLWFMEGMAEYLSIGDLDTHTRAWVRDAVMSGYLRTVAQMSRYDDYLSYRFGQSLWAFIGAKFGDEIIGLILQRAPRLGIETAFRATLGVGLSELSEEWVESVRTVYLPQAASHGGGREYGRRLTDHSFRPRTGNFASYLSPALSPDGREIVYLSDRGESLHSDYDLWLASVEDGEPKEMLVKAARAPGIESLRFITSSASWSPDGVHLAFAAQAGGRDALYIFDVAQKRVVHRISVDLDGIQNPTFSPDGLRVAFTGIKGGISDLYVVDVSGAHFRQLTDDRYAELHPAWSPSGEYIAFTTDRGEGTDFEDLVFGNYRIALYRMGDGDIQLLPHQDGGDNLSPAWSPDGDEVAFVSDRTGINNIFLWSLREGRLFQVTDLLSGVSGITPLSPSIAWSARADRLAFVYFEGAGYNIYVLDDPRNTALAAGPAEPEAAGPSTARGADSHDPEDHGGSEPLSSGGGQSYYSFGDGFRLSASRPGTDEVVREELTVASLMDDARMGLLDTARFEDRRYSPTLTPDVVGQPVVGAQVGGNFGNGIYGGSYIVLSDMLGNHNLLLSGQIAGSLSDAYLRAEYAYLRERANLIMGYQQFPLYRFRGTSVLDPAPVFFVEDRFVRDIYRSLSSTLQYPLNRFKRFEFAITGAHVSRDSVVETIVLGPNMRTRDRTTLRVEDLVLAGPSVALVSDNALFGYVGPLAGHRYRLEVGRFFGDVEVNDVAVDVRKYWHLGGQFALANRVLGLWRSGPSADEFRLYWGGPYFIRGYDGGSFRRVECVESAKRVTDEFTTGCPIRDQLIGTSVVLASTEFRFPIFDFLDLGFVPLGIPPVGGVVFFDIGAAFNSLDELVWSRAAGADPFTVREPVASYGVGIRMNVLYTLLRVDFTVPLDRPDHSGGVWSLSVGPAF